jgi:hypothetical protein
MVAQLGLEPHLDSYCFSVPSELVYPVRSVETAVISDGGILSLIPHHRTCQRLCLLRSPKICGVLDIIKFAE